MRPATSIAGLEDGKWNMKANVLDICDALRGGESILFQLSDRREREAAEIKRHPAHGAPHRKKDRARLRCLKQEAAECLQSSTLTRSIAEAFESAAVRPKPEPVREPRKPN